MDLVNCGRVNPFHPQSNAEVNTIRGVMIQKHETMQYIEREMEQLLEKKKIIEEDLVCLRAVLAPHNHNRLPNEVLSRIFVLVAQDYGPVDFPIRKLNHPPQLAISHVCSHWRRVALHTSELWSDARLAYPERNGYLDQTIYLRHWQRWLMRAGNFPVTISINFSNSLFERHSVIASVLQRLLLPFQLRRLHLAVTIKSFKELSELPENILSDPTDLDLDLTLDAEANINMNDPHPLISRLQSVTFHSYNFDLWLGRLSPGLPWSQLRSLDFDDTFTDNAHLLINILHQIPMLQVLKLRICNLGPVNALEILTMPSLQDFALTVHEGMERILDKVLLNFTCPSLSKFKLITLDFWTTQSFEILKRQYNMQHLHEINFYRFPLPISSILQKAPELRVLSIGTDAILDDAAIIGISSGTLGRFLMKLNLRIPCDADDVVGMVETRIKTVNAMIENGCSWRDEITILRDVAFRGNGRGVYQLEERINALKTVGINFTIR